jgi:hypothetical protein
MLSMKRRCAAVTAAVAVLAVAMPVAGAGAAIPLPALPPLGAGLNINDLCPTVPGFLNMGPTGPMGPLGANGPQHNANDLPTGCAAWNLGPSGPLGPHGVLAGGG